MGLQEQQVVMVLADISGYTRFMTSNQKSLAHSQIIISELINTLLKEVDLPLNLIKLEGDAIFLYAAKTGSKAEWSDNRHKISEKLLSFFKVFSHKVIELTKHSICMCGACVNIDRLRLKVVAHTGVAIFQHIGNLTDLYGVDVIAVHRLLKNSVNADEYILLSESAQYDIPLPGLKSWENQETYDELGTIKTFVYLAPEPPPYEGDPNAKSNYEALFMNKPRDEVQKE